MPAKEYLGQRRSEKQPEVGEIATGWKSWQIAKIAIDKRQRHSDGLEYYL